MIKTTPPRPLVQTSSKPRPDEGPTYLVHLVPLRRRGRGFGRGRYDEPETFVLDEPTEGETMARNPHEIVTLDDQEACPCGCGHELISFRCLGCGHAQSPHHELGVGKCDLVIDGEMCSCSRYEAPIPHIDIDYGTDTRKPMRIRCMELPGEINPNTNELATPFVIVIDRVTGGPIDIETGNAIALNTGARGVLVFEQEIQIGDDPE